MKNLLKLIIIFGIIITSGFSIINNTYADNTGSTSVKVTEEVPGGNCTVDEKNEDGTPKTYKCESKSNFQSVMDVMTKMIKYATLLASLAGVLFIVINGIAISMSGVDSSAKEAAKGRIVQTLLGLILLLLTGTLLNIIAPWIYK